MSLQRKFGLLLVLLGAGVLVNIAVSVWSVGLLDREQRWPIEQIGSVLGKLNSISSLLWDQSLEIGFVSGGEHGPKMEQPSTDALQEADEAKIERYHAIGLRALAELGEMEKIESYAVRSGVNTTRNLRRRIMLTTGHGIEYLKTGDPEKRILAIREFSNLHELILRLETRLTNDARLSASYADQVRHRLMFTLGGSVISVLSLLLAAGWFFRRWFLLRLEELRVAAVKLGGGDFAHRVPVQGQDELDRVGLQMNEMATTIVRMQQESIERERLAVVGEMARCLAHNIRNPLAGIRSLAELSEHDVPENTPIRDHQQRIILTVDRFIQWLNQLLSVSNPLAVEPTMQPVTPWIEGLVEALRPMAEGKSVQLDLETENAPESARYDQRHLEQAVLAIVTNAVEFTPPKGCVHIFVSSDAAEDAWSITISDDGPGIAPSVIGDIFKAYVTTKRGGTGIGLAQSMRVVRGHGGQLWAENCQDRPEVAEKGKGAVFYIRLPLAAGVVLDNIGQERGK